METKAYTRQAQSVVGNLKSKGLKNFYAAKKVFYPSKWV